MGLFPFGTQYPSKLNPAPDRRTLRQARFGSPRQGPEEHIAMSVPQHRSSG